MGKSTNTLFATGVGLLALYVLLVLAFWIGVFIAVWKFVFA